MMPELEVPRDDTPATIGDLRRIAISHQDEGSAGPSVTLDWSTSTAKRITIGGPCDVAFTGTQAGGVYTLELEHEHDGAALMQWPESVLWATPAGMAPMLSARRDVRDILVFYCDGATCIGTEYARGIPRAARGGK